MKVERLNKFSFKFEDIDLIYPVYIKCKDGEGYYNFRKSITSSNYSRKYQLDHRSTQSYLFDKFIEIGYFKLLGIDYNFITEMVLINTNLTNDSTRSYYLLDYFIPDLSLAIELDSNYHDQNPIKDKLKDQFLNSIGIDVVRIRDFNIDTKSKLESLVEYIKEKRECKFELSYEELIEEYIKSISHDELDHIRIKWKPVVELFCSLDGGFKDAIINKKPYKLSFTLDEIWDLTREVLPMSVKEARKYYPLINYLRKFGIEVEIKSNGGRFMSNS